MAWALPLIGPAIGALGSLFSGGGKSKPDKVKNVPTESSGTQSTNQTGKQTSETKNSFTQIPNFDPQQLKFLQNILSQSNGSTGNAFDYLNQILSNNPEQEEAFNAPAMRNFEEDIIPSILERYGGRGSKNSSALQQTLGRAGQNLATDLNAQRANLKGNAINQLLQYSNLGLTQKTTPFSSGSKSTSSSNQSSNTKSNTKGQTPYIKEGQPGIFNQLAGPAANAFSSWLTSQPIGG